jgi:hypothetical protein
LYKGSHFHISIKWEMNGKGMGLDEKMFRIQITNIIIKKSFKEY